MNLITASAAEIAALVRHRKVSAREVAQEMVAHVEQVNPKLNALINFDGATVLRDAQALDHALAHGQAATPLAGVHLSVKDNLWIRGRLATQGSRLFADFIAPDSALAVARAQRAGGVVLGTSNCSEFACKGVTTNRVHGATRNPWNLDRTPGGSSGGAAAAVAAGLGHVALCTDGGGSTRRPAAHTGIVGFKPSAGAIAHPVGFAEPVFGNSVVGIMARTVADVGLLFAAIAGGDCRDQMGPPPADFLQPLRLDRSLHGLRVAYSPRLGLDAPVDEDVQGALQQAATWLSEAGAQVLPMDPPWPAGTSEEALMPLQFSGLAALYGEHFRRDPSVFDPDIAVQIARGLSMPAAQVAHALMLRESMFRALAVFFAQVDLLLCPTTPCVAWPLDDLGPRTIAGQPVAPRAHAVFTPAFNHVYAPACSVPVALSRDLLPIGAQLVGWRWRDADVLRAAAVLESRTDLLFQRPHLP